MTRKGDAMRGRRGGIVAIVLVAGLAGCSGPRAPLPPVPAGSGGVMVRAGEPPPVKDGQAVIDRVVAVVNNEVIMMSELQEAMALYRRDAKPGTDAAEVERQILNRMVDHRLQVQEARREKIEVSEEDLRGMVDDFVKRNGGDREKIEAQLRAQGVSWEALRRELRDQLLASRVRSRRVVRRAMVTETEVDAYLAENRSKFEADLKYRAGHIAVTAEPPNDPAAWDRAKTEIDGIATQLAAGADFAELARTRSKDPSAASGGDLGWLPRGELDPVFEEPLLRLQVGQVTAPLKSGAAYHLFKLEERETLTPDRLADVRQQVRDLLVQKKAGEKMEEWLETLRRRAIIAIRL